MKNIIYNLPQINFIGGESQTLLFNLCTIKGSGFDASECEVSFAIIYYANKNSLPLITKTAEILKGKDGVMSIASVELIPEDTVDLYGRYVYQISIRDIYNNTGIPGQGIIDVTRNIHTNFITN